MLLEIPTEMLMSYLTVTLTTRGREPHNLELLPCTVTGSSLFAHTVLGSPQILCGYTKWNFELTVFKLSVPDLYVSIQITVTPCEQTALNHEKKLSKNLNLDGWYYCNRDYMQKKAPQFSKKNIMASKRSMNGRSRIYQMKGGHQPNVRPQI